MKYIFKNSIVVAIFASVLLISGCVSYLTPKLGSLAQEDSILKLDTLGDKPQEWETDEVQLKFSTLITGDEIELSGDLIFTPMLTNTYNKIKRFNVKMSFVDTQRQVLSTIDITPMISKFNTAPEKSKLHVRTQIPQGAEAIAFNYYGIFAGDERNMGTTEVFYSPFN